MKLFANCMFSLCCESIKCIRSKARVEKQIFKEILSECRSNALSDSTEGKETGRVNNIFICIERAAMESPALLSFVFSNSYFFNPLFGWTHPKNQLDKIN